MCFNEFLDTGTIINVIDYGADPIGKRDSTGALNQIFKEIKNIRNRVTINFPNGEYHFHKSKATKKQLYTSNTSSMEYPEKWVSILIENQSNLIIEGNGSLFIFHGDVMGIAVIDSCNIQLQHFSIDYFDPNTVDITIVNRGEKENKAYTDFYIPNSYNYKISENQKEIIWYGDVDKDSQHPYWKEKNTMDAYLVIFKGYDWSVRRHEEKNESGQKISDPFVGIEKIVELEPGRLRFCYKSQRPCDQDLGNIFLLCNSRIRKTTGVFFWNSSKIQAQKINVHYLSGFGWLVQMCEDVVFSRMNFAPRPGTGKVTTSNADQIHVVGCKGKIEIKDSHFTLSHDDPINIHGAYLRIEDVIDSQTLRLKYVHRQQGGYQQFFKGNEIEFFSRYDLKSFSEISQVVKSYPPGSNYCGEILDRQTEIIILNKPLAPELQEKLSRKIEVMDNGQTMIEGEYVVENITYAPSVTIRNSTFQSIPTRAILCTTRKPVVIENNCFKNISMATIYLSNDAYYWYESGPIRDMLIKKNCFYVSSSGQDEWSNAPAIFIDPVLLPNNNVENQIDLYVHENINVKDNQFILYDDNAIVVKNTNGIIFESNRIIDKRDKQGSKEFFQYSSSRDIVFSENEFNRASMNQVRNLDTNEVYSPKRQLDLTEDDVTKFQEFSWEIIGNDDLVIQEINKQCLFIDASKKQEIEMKFRELGYANLEISGLIDNSKQIITDSDLKTNVKLKLYTGVNYFDFSIDFLGKNDSILKLVILA